MVTEHILVPARPKSPGFAFEIIAHGNPWQAENVDGSAIADLENVKNKRIDPVRTWWLI